MVNCVIDNKNIEVEEGSTILFAANKANIYIPTLCYEADFNNNASCRICVVEIVKDGISTIVSSCNTKVSDGLVVYTKSEKALEARKFAVKWIYSINKDIPLINKLAAELGITDTFKIVESDCIHCGKCALACHETVGQNALNATLCGLSYGNDKPEITWDYNKCIACGSCAFVCPTKTIRMIDENGVRTIITPSNKHEFPLQKCRVCGDYFMPKAQVEYMIKKTGLPVDKFDICMNCR